MGEPMDRRLSSLTKLLGAALLAALAGCATRPVNPPAEHVDPDTGYRFDVREARAEDTGKETIVVLAFSGGGTRAAAFSYGVLEFLRKTRITEAQGRSLRLLDSVDLISGVSGGSFTALAYGLYGEKLFDDFETSFLKRNVQGEITARALDPANWPRLMSTGWGRSELAAELYDEILFHGATFGDLTAGKGPMILATATDLSSGSRFVFNQSYFDVICSDLGAVRLSRAASASSAVPVVLSAVTLNNYAGQCDYKMPSWTAAFLDSDDPPRPAARAIRTLRAMQEIGRSGHGPYLHLVDGGVADNLGMRSVLDALEIFEARTAAGERTRLDKTRRIVVVVVNSLSEPPTDWDMSEAAPGPVTTMLKTAGTPIDRNSFENVEQLRDTAARWRTLRRIANSKAMTTNTDAAVARALRVPQAEIYAIDVSFAQLADRAEFDYLNRLPTSFVLPPEAVDRLRSAAEAIILASPEFKRLLADLGAKIETGATPVPKAQD